MQVRQTRTPSSGLSMRTTRWQRGQAGRTIPATPASCSSSISRGIARSGARCPRPVSRPGWASSAQASLPLVGRPGCAPADGRGDGLPRRRRGSSSAITWWITVIGSRPSCVRALGAAWPPRPVAGGDLSGVSRRRRTVRRRGPQTAQYQCWPRRCRVRSCLPHPAQHGGEIVRGAGLAQGEQQVTDGPRRRGPAVGQHARAARSGPRPGVGHFARPPATAVTTARICSGSSCALDRRDQVRRSARSGR